MLSDFEAAVEAALLRQSITSRDIADPFLFAVGCNSQLKKEKSWDEFPDI